MKKAEGRRPALSTQTDETRDTHTDQRENGGTETRIKVRYCVSLPACGEMNHEARLASLRFTGWLIKPSPFSPSAFRRSYFGCIPDSTRAFQIGKLQTTPTVSSRRSSKHLVGGTRAWLRSWGSQWIPAAEGSPRGWRQWRGRRARPRIPQTTHVVASAVRPFGASRMAATHSVDRCHLTMRSGPAPH